jgi:hypothetical protein
MPLGANLDKARLYHAFREAGLEPLLGGSDLGPMLQLRSHVHMEAAKGPSLQGISVEHGTPRTRIGNISRPYVFPHELADLCRSYWKEERSMPVSFRGLITARRSRALQKWQNVPGVHILHSIRGRESGVKYWDAAYFAELADSECVLCPDGDFPFSYRTFESALCGALPIVETEHECYGKLEVATMGEVDPAHPPEWSKERALRNYEIARALVTVPLEELRREVYRLGEWKLSE